MASPQPDLNNQSEDNVASSIDSLNETRLSRLFEIKIVKDVNGLGCVIEGGRIPDLIERPIVIKRIFRGKLGLETCVDYLNWMCFDIS